MYVCIILNGRGQGKGKSIVFASEFQFYHSVFPTIKMRRTSILTVELWELKEIIYVKCLTYGKGLVKPGPLPLIPPKINYKYYSNLNISEKLWELDSVPVLPLPSYVTLTKPPYFCIWAISQSASASGQWEFPLSLKYYVSIHTTHDYNIKHQYNKS